jgi:hypothetical protein
VLAQKATACQTDKVCITVKPAKAVDESLLIKSDLGYGESLNRERAKLRIGRFSIRSPVINLFRASSNDCHYVSSHQSRLGTPECLPILLPDLQRAKHIYRKTSGQLSLGFIPRYLFMQNERHCF